MLKILTITIPTAELFDLTVNDALKDGWELVKRDCFVTGSDRATTFYAELEREEPQEEEDLYPYDISQWEVTRNPRCPYRCRACGYAAREQWHLCPECGREMRSAE